jgi:predicted lysophospholipase L1 biosynthesis ABC-type transport system permease subunit
LSLAIICLTIAGFSGPRIAATGFFNRVCLAFGLSFVLMSILIIISGPLHLRWGTQRRAETLDQSLIYLIQQRNARTQKYQLAVALLIVGLTGFFGSIISYILQM